MTWEVPGYIAEELLGFGGSGEVWRARAAVTGELVALKRLRAGRDPAEHERLRREAALLAGFEHPHVVRLHGLLSTLGGPVLVLDYAEGGSLAGLVSRQGACSPGEITGLLAPIAGALAAAHEAGLVHGDVSAGNILLGADGRALLADLGTARLVGESGSAVQGTAGFIDPSLRAGAAPGPSSDVYGLAAVAVFALTGTAGCTDPVATLAGLAVPEPALQVLCDALQADPAARPSAAALADGLCSSPPDPLRRAPGAVAIPEAATALTHAVEGRPQPPVPPPAAGRHRSAALRGRRVATRTAAAVILVAAAAVVGLLWGGAAPGQQPAGAAATAQASQVAPPMSWARVWADLDARRSRAFATADAMLLGEVYLPGCPALPVDLTAVRSLAARQAHATGVAHQVISVRAESATAGSVTLVVVDRLRGYDIRTADGRVLTSSPPRPQRTLTALLVRTPRGWRIARLTA